MEDVDPDTGKPRGYLIVTAGPSPASVMFSLAPGTTLSVAGLVEAGLGVLQVGGVMNSVAAQPFLGWVWFKFGCCLLLG